MPSGGWHRPLVRPVTPSDHARVSNTRSVDDAPWDRRRQSDGADGYDGALASRSWAAATTPSRSCPISARRRVGRRGAGRAARPRPPCHGDRPHPRGSRPSTCGPARSPSSGPSRTCRPAWSWRSSIPGVGTARRAIAVEVAGGAGVHGRTRQRAARPGDRPRRRRRAGRRAHRHHLSTWLRRVTTFAARDVFAPGRWPSCATGSTSPSSDERSTRPAAAVGRPAAPPGGRGAAGRGALGRPVRQRPAQRRARRACRRRGATG